MKTPKGLKKLQSKPNESSLDLDKVMHFQSYQDFMKKFKSWKVMEKNQIFQGTELAYKLCAKFAENLTGYSHFSDLYDSAPEFTLKMYAKIGSAQFDSNDDDSSSNDSFDKHDHYENIGNNFKDKVVCSFQAVSLKDLKEFEEFYKFAIKRKAFTGTIEEFLEELKRSQKFLSFLGLTVSRYTG